MRKLLFRAIGHKALKHAAKRYSNRPAGFMGVKEGFALFRDRRVPASYKAAALAIGFTLFLVLQVLELPLEILAAVLLPLVGFEFDLLFNGLEFILLPMVLSCMVLPRLLPKPAYQRAEIIDMPPPMLG